jgi:hypothetical protein
MAKIRKPIPKNQQEISKGLQDPYTGINPNDSIIPLPKFVNPNNESKTYRAKEVSFKGDDVKPFTLGLEDIDESIIYYFNNVIKPFVVQNNQRIAIPIIYGSPEIWKSVQKDGFYRDKNSKIMAPLIMFKKTNIEHVRSIGNKLDANDPQNFGVFASSFNKKNAYNNFNILNNRRPIVKYHAVIIPDYVTLTYECVVWTYYVEQMNKVIESINYASDAYWGDPARFKFNARIDNFTPNVTINQGENRLVKTNFSIKMRGYIIPDSINKELVSTKKFFSKGKFIITMETDVDSEGFSTKIGPKQTNPAPRFIDQILIGGGGSGGTSTGYVDAIASYLNVNIQKTGTYIDSTTIRFTATWLDAPSPLPTTNGDNFIFFINGTLIEKTAIASVIDYGAYSELIININQLGYGFIQTDEVIALGKFVA